MMGRNFKTWVGDLPHLPDSPFFVATKGFAWLQLRNPWGEQSPKTWQGDWGKDSPKWTFRLKRELGVVNANNVAMHDEMSALGIRLGWAPQCLR